MGIRELVLLALRAMMRNKTRMVLTMLGIIIGVGSVVAMIGIGEGSRQASLAIVQSLGSNTLIIFNGGSGGGNSRMGPMGLDSVEVLKEEDSAAIERELCDSSVVAATPQVRTSCAVIYQNNNYLTSIQGTGERFDQIQGWELRNGRLFTGHDLRSQAKVCLLGTTVVANLFPGGGDPIGQTLRIGKVPFEVIGVLESKGAGMMGDQDDVVVAPYTTVMHKLLGRDRIQNILVSAQAGKAELAETEIKALLRQRLRLTGEEEDSFSIRKQEDLVKMMNQQADVMTLFLALAAGISLIVGGIGISNIMLVSVQERTREIGIRQVVGATRRSVLLQFLAEAVAMAFAGGLSGILLAGGVLEIISRATSLPAVVPLWAAGLGILFSAAVGLSAGILPALKAAGLNVIDALRYE